MHMNAANPSATASGTTRAYPLVGSAYAAYACAASAACACGVALLHTLQPGVGCTWIGSRDWFHAVE